MNEFEMKIEDLSEEDRIEIEKFFQFCRLVKLAEEAGAVGNDVEEIIYEDLYGEKAEKWDVLS